MLNGTIEYVNMIQCALKLLESLNEVVEIGDCLVCIWIPELRFF